MVPTTVSGHSSNRYSPRIGCAGWSIPAAHRHLFGEGDSVLAKYATHFNAVEINSSFYRPHQDKTYQRWATSVPENFRFSVKVPKTITHELRLTHSQELMDRFIGEIAGLGDKLGGVLVQLPPSLAFDAGTAKRFFAMMRRRLSIGIACEPRHASWFTDRADQLLIDYQVTRVAADPAAIEAAHRVNGAGSWRYWRWHGSPNMYYSAYDDAALQALADDVLTSTPVNTEAWIIFDNTADGHAIADATRLQVTFTTTQVA